MIKIELDIVFFCVQLFEVQQSTHIKSMLLATALQVLQNSHFTTTHARATCHVLLRCWADLPSLNFLRLLQFKEKCLLHVASLKLEVSPKPPECARTHTQAGGKQCLEPYLGLFSQSMLCYDLEEAKIDQESGYVLDGLARRQ